ncbi:MAG: VOC family protein [Anaerolineae bacterium]
MTLSIDHIVIHVQDLETAIARYRDVGFTVNYGGQHADGITENALIIFADGTYVELIALVDGKTYDEAGFKGLLKAGGEGYTGYALQSDDLEADLEAIRERGLVVGEVREGSRARPDGTLLQWKMAQLDNSMSPFMIQDVTERHLRVPNESEQVTHPNGATGIHEVLIHTNDLEATLAHYSLIFGTPNRMPGAGRFDVGTSGIVITQSRTEYDGLPHQLAVATASPDPLPMVLHEARLLLL